MRSFLALTGTQGLGELVVTSGLGPLAAPVPPPPPPRPPPLPPAPASSFGGGGGGGGFSFPIALADRRPWIDPVVADLYARAEREERRKAAIPEGVPLVVAPEPPPPPPPPRESEERVGVAAPEPPPPAPRAKRVEAFVRRPHALRKVLPRPRVVERVEIVPVSVPSVPLLSPHAEAGKGEPIAVSTVPTAMARVFTWKSLGLAALAGVALGLLAAWAVSATRRRREDSPKENPMAHDDADDETLTTYALMYDCPDEDAFIGSIDKMNRSIPNWKQLMPHVLLVVSPLAAKELQEKIRERRPEVKRLLLVDTSGERAALLPREAISLMQDPRSVD